jgi:endonuclease YncB( thermonuclease family)
VGRVTRRLIALLLVALAAMLLGRDALDGAVDAVRDAARRLPGAGGGPTVARVSHVRDGDTFELGADRVVRMLGIDTPESARPDTPVQCGALEAKDLLLRLLFTRPRDTDGDGLADREGGRGRRVELEGDPTQDNRDAFGRLIRYARLPGADRTLQEHMLAAGWAAVYVYADRRFERFDAFVAAARAAKRARRGVYARCGGDFHRPARGRPVSAAVTPEAALTVVARAEAHPPSPPARSCPRHRRRSANV